MSAQSKPHSNAIFLLFHTIATVCQGFNRTPSMCGFTNGLKWPLQRGNEECVVGVEKKKASFVFFSPASAAPQPWHFHPTGSAQSHLETRTCNRSSYGVIYASNGLLEEKRRRRSGWGGRKQERNS